MLYNQLAYMIPGLYFRKIEDMDLRITTEIQKLVCLVESQVLPPHQQIRMEPAIDEQICATGMETLEA